MKGLCQYSDLRARSAQKPTWSARRLAAHGLDFLRAQPGARRERRGRREAAFFLQRRFNIFLVHETSAGPDVHSRILEQPQPV